MEQIKRPRTNEQGLNINEFSNQESYVFLTMLEQHMRVNGAPLKIMERSLHSDR